tara:strand:+ start:30 stop:242 length:213 start_codon:yes stop_codon:yes gene_type:complete
MFSPIMQSLSFLQRTIQHGMMPSCPVGFFARPHANPVVLSFAESISIKQKVILRNADSAFASLSDVVQKS